MALPKLRLASEFLASHLPRGAPRGLTPKKLYPAGAYFAANAEKPDSNAALAPDFTAVAIHQLSSRGWFTAAAARSTSSISYHPQCPTLQRARIASILQIEPLLTAHSGRVSSFTCMKKNWAAPGTLGSYLA